METEREQELYDTVWNLTCYTLTGTGARPIVLVMWLPIALKKKQLNYETHKDISVQFRISPQIAISNKINVTSENM